MRYAIYFVPAPDSALYRFGSAALGYDAHSGDEVPCLPGQAFATAEWRSLTAEPRRYGFHATLKAPFSLASGFTEDDLIAEIEHFGARETCPGRFPATIALRDGFAAVVPVAAAPEIDLLAESCVRGFDRYRRPLGEAERRRRLVPSLTARQRRHLDQWGYPYVFEDYRFHMTLTGRIPQERAATVLRLLHAALRDCPVPSMVAVESIALLRQDTEDGPFRVIRDALLRNASLPLCGRESSPSIYPQQ
jgi:putative phosphonate metabolism protein